MLTDATADLALTLILAVTRRVGEGERLIRSGTPWAWSIDFLVGRELRGKTLGVVGYGAIGRATAERARAFGMDVIFTASRCTDEPGQVDLGDLLSRADIVTLHCPLTLETRGLIDADALTRMKPTAYLVDTARGPIVDEAALAAALRDGIVAGAALDVFEHEPDVHPELLKLENVVLLPHLGSATVETRTAMALLACDSVLAVLDGQQAPTPSFSGPDCSPGLRGRRPRRGPDGAVTTRLNHATVRSIWRSREQRHCRQVQGICRQTSLVWASSMEVVE